MAKDSSFDVVSEVDLQEVANAVDQAKREAATRYDFKGATIEVEWDGKSLITLTADSEFRLDALIEVLKGKMAKRGVAMRALDFGKREPAAKGGSRQTVTVKRGISTDDGKKIVAAIKSTKLKVQAQLQDDQVRVSGKSRDDLQAVITTLKGQDFGIELQFINYR